MATLCMDPRTPVEVKVSKQDKTTRVYMAKEKQSFPRTAKQRRGEPRAGEHASPPGHNTWARFGELHLMQEETPLRTGTAWTTCSPLLAWPRSPFTTASLAPHLDLIREKSRGEGMHHRPEISQMFLIALPSWICGLSLKLGPSPASPLRPRPSPCSSPREPTRPRSCSAEPQLDSRSCPWHISLTFAR